MNPTLIRGADFSDLRGRVGFVNGLDLAPVRRVYWVENWDTTVARAFHGHRVEQKFMLCVRGAAIVVCIPERLWSDDRYMLVDGIERYVLAADVPAVLHVPGGWANGVRMVEAGSRVLVLSTATLEESELDTVRIDPGYYPERIWRLQDG